MLFSPGWRAEIRQDTVLALFCGGLLLGGTATGGVLWLLSGLAEPLPGDVRAWAIIAVAALGVLRETGVIRLPLPQNARQIPQDVLRRDIRRGALRFGFELGTGVRTYVSASAPYVAALGLILARPGFAATLGVGVAFGVGRGLTAMLAYASRQSWDTRRVIRMPMITKGTALALLAAFILRALH